MADWQKLGIDSLKSARQLLQTSEGQKDNYLRSSISRMYYAVFSAVTSKLLEQKVCFKPGWDGPTHAKLPNLVMNNLNTTFERRRDLRSIIRRLYKYRIDSDYIPGITIDRTLARNALKDAVLAFQFLEILP